MPMESRQFHTQQSFLFHARTLIRECRVELASLVIALSLTALLAGGLFTSLQEWDATAVVMLIGALWMATCVGLYRFLQRTSR